MAVVAHMKGLSDTFLIAGEVRPRIRERTLETLLPGSVTRGERPSRHGTHHHCQEEWRIG